MELPNRPTKDPYQELPVKDFSYINNPNKSTKSSNYKWVWIASCIVVFILLGAGAFLYGHSTKNKSKPPAKVAVNKTVSTPKSISAPNTPLTSYTSTAFNLTVSYPATWTVSTSGTTSMSITSPETSLKADTGSSVNGKIIVTVLNQGALPAGFGTNSVAVLNSQDVNFNKPTSSQAAQTYVSFIQYPATTVKGGLDAIYVTGNNGYLKDDVIPTSVVKAVSPLIIVSFESCQGSACTTLTPLPISSTMWSSTDFSTPLLNIIKSFMFS